MMFFATTLVGDLKDSSFQMSSFRWHCTGDPADQAGKDDNLQDLRRDRVAVMNQYKQGSPLSNKPSPC